MIQELITMVLVNNIHRMNGKTDTSILKKIGKIICYSIVFYLYLLQKEGVSHIDHTDIALYTFYTFVIISSKNNFSMNNSSHDIFSYHI